MKMKSAKIVIAILLTVTTHLVAAAEYRYVIDRIYITLRSGPGDNYQVTRSLKSGTRMEFLEEKPELEYARVRLDDGKEGWVRTQYLTDSPIAEDRLESAEKKVEKLQEDNKKLRDEINAIKTEKKDLEKQHDQLNSSFSKASKDLERIRQVSETPLKLDEENQELRNRTITLEQDLNMSRQEVQLLHDKSDKEWFVRGAGVVVLGILIGLLLPKVRSRKRQAWGEL